MRRSILPSGVPRTQDRVLARLLRHTGQDAVGRVRAELRRVSPRIVVRHTGDPDVRGDSGDALPPTVVPGAPGG